jgi:hypothetical protein
MQAIHSVRNIPLLTSDLFSYGMIEFTQVNKETIKWMRSVTIPDLSNLNFNLMKRAPSARSRIRNMIPLSI